MLFRSNLEKLSKLIYDKANGKEVITSLFSLKDFGIVNPIQASQEQKREVVKPDYQGIGELLRPKIKRERY